MKRTARTQLPEVLRHGRDYLAFCQTYREFLQDPITITQAKNSVRRGLDNRRTNFLRLVEENVFLNPTSPYLPLMQNAHCEMGDLEKMVSSEGLEQTLLILRREGVYISFEEYKGRRPVVRNGREILLSPEDFLNKNLTGVVSAETGGSTGAARKIGVHLQHIAAETAARMMAFEAHGLQYAPFAIWMGVFPDPSGPKNILRSVKHGLIPDRWFANVVPATSLKRRLTAQLYNQTIVLLGRLSGVPIPPAESLPLNQALVVAEWMSETLKSHDQCVVRGQVSKGVRVALAAEEAGLDLTGGIFLLSGEPLTPGKAGVIARTGAIVVPKYSFSEHGTIGIGCADPAGEDEVHVFQDMIEMIQFPRQVPGHDVVVDAFHWTSLSPTAPNILLNVESDDYGIMERRVCGCMLGSCGYHKHLREIRSFQKLTGEGVTLIGSDAIRAIDEVLPARFGGSPLDYQIAEEEDDDGLTRVSLIIDPRVAITSEQEVIDTFVKATGYNDLRKTWNLVDTLRIKRQAPILTRRGKLMPLHLSGSHPSGMD
jgi:hypothetical protein